MSLGLKEGSKITHSQGSTIPDVGHELTAGFGVLVKLLLQHGCCVSEALLPPEGIFGKGLLAFVHGQLSSSVPLILQSKTVV